MHFPSPALSRFAVLVAAIILAAAVVGAYIVSSHQAQIPVPPVVTGARHAVVAVAGGILAIVLSFWLAPSNTRFFVRLMSWMAVGAFLAGTAASAGITKTLLPPGLSIVHAALSPVFFGCVAAVAVFTQPEMMWDPQPIDIGPRPFLRPVALATPWVVILQVILGAAYRYQVLSVMPHMGGAMIVALLLLILCVQVLQNYPGHTTLRPMAITAMSILLAQILLGVVVFTMRLLGFDNSAGFIIVSVAHVTVGTLVFAASLVLALEFQRCLPPAETAET